MLHSTFSADAVYTEAPCGTETRTGIIPSISSFSSVSLFRQQKSRFGGSGLCYRKRIRAPRLSGRREQAKSWSSRRAAPEVRALYMSPGLPAAVRRIALVPGWGATTAGFQDFYAAVRVKAELYYLETRKKRAAAYPAGIPIYP